MGDGGANFPAKKTPLKYVAGKFVRRLSVWLQSDFGRLWRRFDDAPRLESGRRLF